MGVSFVDALPPTAESELSAFEGWLGFGLPRQYREFLSVRNGGRLVDNDGAVDYIFSLATDAPYWLNMRQKLEVFAERVPDWLLPVASDVYGNLFAISLRPSDIGSIWFWDHEEEADEGEDPTEDNLTRVADEWTQFLENLNAVSGAELP